MVTYAELPGHVQAAIDATAQAELLLQTTGFTPDHAIAKALTSIAISLAEMASKKLVNPGVQGKFSDSVGPLDQSKDETGPDQLPPTTTNEGTLTATKINEGTLTASQAGRPQARRP